MRQDDVPAAHFMDTMWFAVDSEGNVALFATGEAGAMPAVCEREFDLDEDVEAALPGGSRTEAFFVYEHTGENWIAAPYALASAPRQPLKVDALPREVLENAVRFEGRFRDTKTLQPAELWKCASWMPAWLAHDGRTARPFAGREDEVDCSDVDPGDAELVWLEARDAEVDAERVVPRTPSWHAREAALAGEAADWQRAWSERSERMKEALDARTAAGARDSANDWSDVLADAPPRPAAKLAAPQPAPKKKPWWKLW